jgi:hypothetical protein
MAAEESLTMLIEKALPDQMEDPGVAAAAMSHS